MSVVFYQSTDASAPQMSGEVGKLVAVLDACLVNGYGSKAAAGWAKSFSGTNKGVYRSSAGNRLYLRIDDTTTTYARAIGYETMSDVDNGTGLFPTAVQLSGGLYWQKSVAANSTARNWWMVANEKFFILVIDYDANLANPQGLVFGTIHSYVTSDAYNTIIMGCGANNNANSFATLGVYDTVSTGHYMARRCDNLSTSIAFNKVTVSGLFQPNTQSGANTNVFTYPDPISGGLHVSGVYVYENIAGKTIRGRIPGLWFIPHTLPFTHLDILQGAAGTELAGKSFIYLRVYSSAAVLLETSNTWYDVGF